MPTRDADINALIVKHDRLLRYCQRRYGLLARGVEAEDYHSAALLGLCRAYDTFEPSRGCRFSTWLFWRVRIAVQAEHKRHARSDWAGLDPLPLNDGILALTPCPAARVAPKFSASLDALPGNQGRMLRLMVRDGLTVEDAGAALGLTRVGAKTVYTRAVRRARQIVSDQLVEE